MTSIAPPALGPYQQTLFGQGEPAVVEGAGWVRTELDEQSWVDVARGWLDGADVAFAELVERLAWEGGRRPMYGELVDEPRLHAAARLADPATPSIVATIAAALDARYAEGFDAVFVNLYRDGRDSVAWHADRVGRHRVDPLVAIVSLGGPRRFALRPMGGGPAHRLLLGSGDAVVMGGACQHGWEHSVPKMASAAPRMSVTLRRAADLPADDQ